MTKLRIGVVGLGGIAQKAYLPILSQAERWQLVGGFSPTLAKAQGVCDSYRMTAFSRLDELAEQCDALFVHSSTNTHFDVVRELLQRGKHVYVDKPLAETLDQAEQLIALAEQKNCRLMVGFNRRFAPRYVQIKQQASDVAAIRMDKHRHQNIGPKDVRFTLLDDYLHVVDTALWMSGKNLTLKSGTLHTNDVGQMIYAEHHFSAGQTQVTTSMHRAAGSQREVMQVVSGGAIYEAQDLRNLHIERDTVLCELPIAGWQSTLEQRGFVGAVNHFIDCVENQTAPITSGEQAIAAQRIIEGLLSQ